MSEAFARSCAVAMAAMLAGLMMLWAGGVGFLWLKQDDILFPPGGRGVAPGAPPAGSPYAEASVVAADGVPIRFWAAPPSGGRPVLLYLHGNGGTGADRARAMEPFARAGIGVVLAEYRGFGGTPGKPSEAGLKLDARAQLEWAQARWPGSPVVLWGESLGTGIATAMAASWPASGPRLAGVVLDAPYLSILDQAVGAISWAPVGLLVRNPFESLAHVPDIRAPLLVIHGELDEPIPVAKGRAMLAAAGCRAVGAFLPGVGHPAFLSAPEAGGRDAATAFLASLDGPDGCPPRQM